MVILRGSDFGHVCTASGTRNFFREHGWWYHRYWRWAGLDFQGTTFIAKTTTLAERRGHLPLRADRVTPRDRRPACIRVYFRQGMTLNAVGLSGPGAQWLLKQGRWQQYTEPFFLSFMAVSASAGDREEECREFVSLLRRHLPDFSAPVGLQANLSCPNVGLSSGELAREADVLLDTLAELGIPIIPKICATLPVELAAYISRHAACDALSVSNAIPWGALPHLIDWVGLFGTTVSPLAEYGGGALSGSPLFPVVAGWLRRVRALGIAKPLMAGGGVQSWRQAKQLLTLGATAIELGTVCLLRPWRVPRIVRHVQRFCEQKGVTHASHAAQTR